uniref:Plastid light harvesting protein n=1 Tax=Chromera velia CCMP2878 TaxID=1169474 RepID=A0A0G4HHB2_9ALVE|eukprot:Cvel_27628.t1-p1 / transcript=Cvel_27628.t1 / gene=Cvel_27628 / organism=Chromera_velia_CCMP2878 / gene_product=Fucoxanthin-chlorophyll a-c binding protein,, putative / transcript_product=Fucoxanthin-chlorophyll a-c binding protein,, putative / location=Cvel_scaffold3476:5753-7507(-) / protein_length=273 / sequence_SO=supercontig / SO=protein_coding / is_pseudo=false
MFRYLSLCLCLVRAGAFTPPPRPLPSFSKSTQRGVDKLHAGRGVSGEKRLYFNSNNIRDWAGITPGLGFWDPVGFVNSYGMRKVALFQEAEIKHGRVAMLAVLGYLFAEAFHPFFLQSFDVEPGWKYLPLIITNEKKLLADMKEQMDPGLFWGFLPWLVFFFELQSYRRDWVSPYTQTDIVMLEEGHEPGASGFDPFKLMPSYENPDGRKWRRTVEIMNGRAAMLGFAVAFIQELIFRKPVMVSIREALQANAGIDIGKYFLKPKNIIPDLVI